MRVGVIDYLFKPFSSDELIESVERAVEWRRNAVRARATAFDLEQAIVDRVGQLRTTFNTARVTSAAALDALLEQLYEDNRSALHHVRRVARHSTRVAAQLGVVESQLVAIRHAGLLHDIGKLALPPSLLTKATPLTDHELTLFRTHTEIGTEIVAGAPWLTAVAPIVGGVRERFDGTGYPCGTAGAAIPLGSRIIAAAELFDSMLVAHLADEAASMDVVNAALVQAAGTRLDPAVVAAWLRYVDTTAFRDLDDRQRGAA
jgi:two-component system response regulator RpfG